MTKTIKKRRGKKKILAFFKRFISIQASGVKAEGVNKLRPLPPPDPQGHLTQRAPAPPSWVNAALFCRRSRSLKLEGSIMVEMTQACSESLCNPSTPDSLHLHKHVIEGRCCIVHPGDNAARSRTVRLLRTHKNRHRWRLCLTCCRGLRRVAPPAETRLKRPLSAQTRPSPVWLSPNHKSGNGPALCAEL